MKEIDCRQGRFGQVRIMERLGDGARLYCIGEGVQTMAAADGTSLFGHVHAIKLLIRSAKTVLMLGGGGGSLATMLARRGVEVTVVDIDPVAEDLARRYFGLDQRVRWITQDAGDFLKSCSDKFEALVIDTCDERGAVAAFATPASLVGALGVLLPGGAMVLNLASDGAPCVSAWQLASALVARGFTATLYRPGFGDEGNELLHVPLDGAGRAISIGDLSQRPPETWLYLNSLEAFVPKEAGPFDSNAIREAIPYGTVNRTD
jgi:predicted membrane-bound spermidine synthase